MKKIISIFMLVALMCSFAGCETSEPSIGSIENPSTNDNTITQEQVLVDNDIVKVTFIEIFEEPSIANTCYVRLRVENKSDKTVMVSIKDSYVNDTAQMMGTGVPIVLEPGKSSQQPFFFGYGNLGITDKSEISKMEFKVLLMDNDTYDTVFETDSHTINIE